MITRAIVHALKISGLMTWQILWALILGFILSALIQALVSRDTVSKSLGGSGPKPLIRATLLGIASSSCSYAAVALARTLWIKGASFTSSMIFEISSTNLVIELGIILTVLISWQFTVSEFIAGPLMILIVALMFRLLLRKKLLVDAKEQSLKRLPGSMEGHAQMDMSIKQKGNLWQKLKSKEGLNSISGIFVMEWSSIIRDIIIGLLIAGAIAAWVPVSFWSHFFLNSHPLASKIWGPIIGPVISMASFVCSIGNVPLAGVLWSSGISFGGVTSFIFADLIILPILFIYKKYYGVKMTLFILSTFYFAMVIAGYFIEVIFSVLHLIPTHRNLKIVESGISWNYTTLLNIIFIIFAGFLIIKFYKNGGKSMLKMMNQH